MTAAVSPARACFRRTRLHPDQKAGISERREAPEKPGWLALIEGELGGCDDAGADNNPRVVQLFADASFSGIKQDSVVCGCGRRHAETSRPQ
ncbi:hypothetical protein [Methylorubrum populi]|uniref:hypothetical protein n=1 Tax=Methylorubrum TaxID=2282523 RepID=UPI003F65BD8E